MKLERLFLLPLAVALAVPAWGASTIVDENFNSYADTAAMEAVWRPTNNDFDSTVSTVGELLPTTNTGLYPAPYDNPPGIDGQAIGGSTAGNINEHTAVFDLIPTASEKIVLRGDIFTDNTGNWRQTIGLRNDTVDRDPNAFGFQRGMNILEMGYYNADTCNITDPGCDAAPATSQQASDPWFIPTSEFGYRMTIFQFGSYGDLIENGVNQGAILTTPEYQYFPLSPDLDLTTTVLPNGNSGNEDGIVNTGDIGTGWHTFQAEIFEAGIILTLDLFRDGLDNATGLPGVDSTVEITGVAFNEDPSNPGTTVGMTSLRVGGPSGITGNTVAAYDNIFLGTEDVATAVPGDFDGDGFVGLSDLNILGANFGLMMGGTLATGDANGDGAVDLADLNILGANWNPPPAVSVPEPTTALMATLMAAIGASLAKRRR